ncbi:MAG: hypothetical protein KKF50_04610 [Nanoarchaeota archaeon]|nr:hypothetical protein [Nanoarchaeota archaeon]
MNSKRGILGGIIATFVATVVILIILIIFVFASGIIKKVAGVDEGVRVFNEADVGIPNIFNYLPNYLRLAEVKVSARQGDSIEMAVREAGYVR